MKLLKRETGVLRSQSDSGRRFVAIGEDMVRSEVERRHQDQRDRLRNPCLDVNQM